MRISDWSSDVCSSDLLTPALGQIDRAVQALRGNAETLTGRIRLGTTPSFNTRMVPLCVSTFLHHYPGIQVTVEELSADMIARRLASGHLDLAVRSEEHTSELQSLLRMSYAVLCLKHKKYNKTNAT